MKTEELKTIAKGMKHEITYEATMLDENIIFIGKGKKQIEYNPITDSAQCVEIMEKLKLTIECMADDNYRAYPRGKMRLMKEGETINEAVCRAALEYFKEE